MPRRPPAAVRAAILACSALLVLGGVFPPLAAGEDRPALPQEEIVPRDTAEELREADRRFAAAVAAATGSGRTAAWVAWFANDGCQIVPGAVVKGHAAIGELMAPAFADTAYTLTWEPDLAAGSADGGWTSGRYLSTHDGPNGTTRSEGRYLTIWKRIGDGSWRVAVDTGVPDGE